MLNVSCVPGNMLGIMGRYKRGRDPELHSLTDQTRRCEMVTNKTAPLEPTRALDNKCSRSSEVRGHRGLGAWADFLEKVGFNMSLVVGQDRDKALLEVRGTRELGIVRAQEWEPWLPGALGLTAVAWMAGCDGNTHHAWGPVALAQDLPIWERMLFRGHTEEERGTGRIFFFNKDSEDKISGTFFGGPQSLKGFIRSPHFSHDLGHCFCTRPVRIWSLHWDVLSCSLCQASWTAFWWTPWVSANSRG